MKAPNSFSSTRGERRALFALLGLSVVAAMALMGYLIWSGYREAISTAETTSRNYAAIIEARLDATLRRADAHLQELVRDLPIAALSQRAVPRYASELDAELDLRLLNFPELTNMRVFDADGGNLYSTNRATLPRTNVVDRDYFRQLRDNPQADLVFSEVIIARATGQPTVVAARALRNEQNIFRGVAVAAINFEYFQKLFQSLDLGRQGFLAIHRSNDFTRIVRRPPIEGMLNSPLPVGHPTRVALAQGNRMATVTRIFSSDGIERISSYKVLDHYPFFITAALASEDVLAGWRVRSLGVSLGALLLLGLLAALLYRLVHAERQQVALAAIVDGSHDAIIGRNLDRRIVYWNTAAERLFGWTAAEAIGQTASLIVPPEREEEVARNRAFLAQGRAVIDSETERLTKDGRRIPVSLTQSPIRSASDTLFGVSLVFRDITERKQAEQALKEAHERLEVRVAERTVQLREQEQRLAYLLAETPVTIYTCRSEPPYAATFVSDNISQSLGYSAEEFLGTPNFWADHIHPEDRERVFAGLQRLVEHRKHAHEYRFLHKNGDCRWMYDELRAGHGPDGKATELIGYFVDITERKLAESMLIQSTADLKAAYRKLAETEEQERRTLARELHDQVSQNLSALNLNLNRLNNALGGSMAGEPRKRVSDSLALVEDTAQRIRDIMSFLRPPMLDDYGLFATLRWWVHESATRSGMAIELTGEEVEPRLPNDVELTLFRVIQEALLNAIKYSGAKHITVSYELLPGSVRLGISDDGRGMVPDAGREASVRSTWGILNMRERAEAIGGSLRVESAAGAGTRIVVEVARDQP